MADNQNSSVKENQTPSEDKKIIDEALDRFKLSEEAFSEIRQNALEDIKFSTGEQWPLEIKRERDRDGRPCLVINKIPQFIQQITNDQRQNRPSIKVHPVDDRADIDTAKIIQGLIRHIEYNSSADVAYDTAFEGAVKGGFGFYRVISGYSDPLSFDQELLIKAIRNPFTVSFDPFSTEPDGSDANWAMISDFLALDEFKAKYPNSKLSSLTDWKSIGDTAPGWMKDGTARIAEYFYKEFKKETICQLNTGESVIKSELPEMLPEGIQVVAERETSIPVVHWLKINALEILERTIWPGKYIPVIPVYGSIVDVDGKLNYEGIVRQAKDPMRMYNYWATAETEAIALAPKAPWIGVEGQFEGHEAEWANANRKNLAFLEYKPTSINGQPAPAPQRNVLEPPVQAITHARMIASDDLKSVTGIYDAALGNRSNETSGVAINSRKVQAQTSNFHFVDNLTRSLKHCGRILIECIPHYYDAARTARIIGEDGQPELVKLNQPFDQGGQEKIYRMDVGQYDVTVDVGPSYATKRQEAVASMVELTRAYPQIAQIAGDLLVKNMDWPGAQEFADRIKKTLPPNLVDDPKKQQPLPPQVQAQMQQMGQMIEQMTEQLKVLNAEKEQKLVELESKERIEMAKIQNQASIELAKLESKESLQLLAHQISQIEQRLSLLNFDQPIEDESQEQLYHGEPDGDEMSAMSGQPQQQPTGGFSPGIPVEGNDQ